MSFASGGAGAAPRLLCAGAARSIRRLPQAAGCARIRRIPCRSRFSGRPLNRANSSVSSVSGERLIRRMAITARRRAGRVAAAVCLALPALSAQAAYVVVDTGHTPARPGHGRQWPGGVSVQPRAERRRGGAADGAGRTGQARGGRRRRGVAGAALAAGAGCGFLHLHPSRFDAAEVHRRGPPARIRGLSIFVSQRNPRYEESLRCAKAIGEALAAGEKPSLYHAEPIAGENRLLLDRRLGVHRFDGLAVLKTATMPAVLVEAGVIVNPDDEARVARPDTIERMARAISDGVHACLGG